MKSLKHKLIIFLTNQESESSYVVPTMLVHEKDGSWSMCFDCQAFNNILIHEEARFKEWNNMKDRHMKVINGWYLIQEDGFGYT